MTGSRAGQGHAHCAHHLLPAGGMHTAPTICRPPAPRRDQPALCEGFWVGDRITGAPPMRGTLHGWLPARGSIPAHACCWLLGLCPDFVAKHVPCLRPLACCISLRADEPLRHFVDDLRGLYPALPGPLYSMLAALSATPDTGGHTRQVPSALTAEPRPGRRSHEQQLAANVRRWSSASVQRCAVSLHLGPALPPAHRCAAQPARDVGSPCLPCSGLGQCLPGAAARPDLPARAARPRHRAGKGRQQLGSAVGLGKLRAAAAPPVCVYQHFLIPQEPALLLHGLHARPLAGPCRTATRTAMCTRSMRCRCPARAR